MEKTSYESGTPCWADLGAADPDNSITFYSELFGWTAGEEHTDAGGYHLCLLQDKPVAGIGPRPDGAPPHWNTYISVADAEATTARVLVAGGEVLVDPMDVMDQGRMGVYTDSTGAAFSIWQPKAHRGSALVNEEGAICWHELATRNSITATDFYRQVFDWVADVDESGGTPYTLWKLGDMPVASMVQMDERWPEEAPSHWLTYFAVDDCDAAVTKITAAGGRLLSGPVDIPPGRYAGVADPEGAAFAVMRLGQP